jgi:hypothetical protein
MRLLVGYGWHMLDNLLDAEQVARLKPTIDQLSPQLNAYLRSLGNR